MGVVSAFCLAKLIRDRQTVRGCTPHYIRFPSCENLFQRPSAPLGWSALGNFLKRWLLAEVRGLCSNFCARLASSFKTKTGQHEPLASGLDARLTPGFPFTRVNLGDLPPRGGIMFPQLAELSAEFP
jgi:hypothetical protein